MVIGVTGGVGTGKSAIMNILQEFGARLIIADDVARDLQQPGRVCYDQIVRAFGRDILEDDHDEEGLFPIDRARLAAMVFADERKLEKLNSIVHPQVKSEIQGLISYYYEEDPSALIAIEAALLIEAGYEDILDELWVVITDRDKRIERLISSRGYTAQKAESIMASQLSDEAFTQHADFVINNSSSLDDARAQVASRLKDIYLK